MKIKFLSKLINRYYKNKSYRVASKISVLIDEQIELSKSISDSVCDIIEKRCGSKHKAAFYESIISEYMSRLSVNYYNLADKSSKLIKHSKLPHMYKITLLAVFREGFADALDITQLTKRLLVIASNIIVSRSGASSVFKVTVENSDDEYGDYGMDFDPNMDSEEFFEEYYKQFEEGEE
ncbi:MAG: hypothetical protein LBL93_03515 [Ruminococcus sp.]|jgi:hypothetical protein|nr:hypothetical protein [Ruminococcus sp.]